MPTTCDIVFDQQSGVYYAGQDLSGTVNLLTDKEKTIRAIYITIFGHAKTWWSETQPKHGGSTTRRCRVSYKAEEEYLSYRTYVLGMDGGSSFTLNPGSYNYSFGCPLPRNIPTSFDGECGRIRYFVMLTIDRPFRFDNVFKQAFTVILPLDLNFDPRYRLPAYREDSKDFCCWCCSSGPVKFTLSIVVVGYVPGQPINFTFFVDNESNFDIDDIVVGIKQEVRFISEVPERKIRKREYIIDKKNLDRVLRLTRKELNNSIVLPPVPQSTLDTCKCIQIQYFLYANVQGGYFHNDCVLSIPITVGAIPLIDVPSALNDDVISTQSCTTPVTPVQPIHSESPDMPPAYNIFMPPSYREAVCLGGITEHDPEEEQQHNFKPFVAKYPVYDHFPT